MGKWTGTAGPVRRRDLHRSEITRAVSVSGRAHADRIVCPNLRAPCWEEIMAIRLSAFVIAATCFMGTASALAQNDAPGWVTSWSTSQQGLAQQPIANATLRLIARVTIPGEAIRVR